MEGKLPYKFYAKVYLLVYETESISLNLEELLPERSVVLIQVEEA